jgi:hypothetical protein
LNVNIASNRPAGLLIAAASLFAISGFISIMPVHAQTTNTTTNSTTNTSSSGHAAGHNCPNMGDYSGNISSAATGTSASSTTG